MDVFKELREKYDIEEDKVINRLVVNKPIGVKDFILLKKVAKYKGIKEIKVERKASVYEKNNIVI